MKENVTVTFLKSEREKLLNQEQSYLEGLALLQQKIELMDSLIREAESMKGGHLVLPTPVPPPAKKPAKKKPAKKRRSPLLPELSVTDEELVDSYFTIEGRENGVSIRQWTDAINRRRFPGAKQVSPKDVRNKLVNWKTSVARPWKLTRPITEGRSAIYFFEKAAS